jgi:hypothetical protein
MKNLKTFEDFYFMEPDVAFKYNMDGFRKINVKLADDSVVYSTYKFDTYNNKHVEDNVLKLDLLKSEGISLFVEKEGELTFYNNDNFFSKRDSDEMLNYFNNKFNTNYKELNFI